MGSATSTNIKLKLAFFIFIVCWGSAFSQGNAKFRVMLDPGHGGEDPGASYNGVKEKDVVLSVALKIGKILEKQDVQTGYTRKTDVFIPLDERCSIANKANANLFVSIHCNAEPKKSATGAETWVMGPAKNASHLEVAKRENSVISYESDKTKYEGFDPNKPETFIGLMMQHEQSAFQSIHLAKMVQDRLVGDLKRKDRGVKQGPFLVLHRTAMPSILIELGFLSYVQEGQYLDSEAGQDEMAESIAKAILAYRQEYFVPGDVDYVAPLAKDEPKVKAPKGEAPKGQIYKVQIAASGRDLDLVPSNFKGLSEITKEKGKSIIKYYYGNTSDKDQANALLAEAKAKGFPEAFIVVFKDGRRI
ncbi:N-acetylmuramoyl-L-alanine amidase [Flavobacterium sp. MFBS3-15]|uniref:N-acetylmuramoyl-L-alanine amidase family protein n=1 Tax=Flavobacterium sp. MFBS3-15 TaxID=2989816 RepID=UPI002235F216|nr:N-acetylmuramoyl-L-alanine amidase [Flavobacterium sp. MFBS3-15]MCW4470265.1 N-acetylmuramoyl-L-alanine amidase [Flavobacterium sp. MFBS3-15]